MRRLAFFAVFLGTLLLSGCSFLTDFVVINDSQEPIVVTYRFKFAGQIEKPATVARSQVSKQRPDNWQELPPDRYELDRVSRVVKVRLMPAEALRVATKHNYSSHEAANKDSLDLDELSLQGARGEIVLRGDQVRLTFVKQSANVLTLTYQ